MYVEYLFINQALCQTSELFKGEKERPGDYSIVLVLFFILQYY